MTNLGRKRKKNGFTQIDNSVFENEKLSYRAKGLIGYLLSRPNNWKFNKTDLVRRSTEGRDAVYKAIDELKEQNYLHIYPNRLENGMIDGWIWEYDDVPFETVHLKNRTTEKQPNTGDIQRNNRTTEKPYDGKTVRRFSSTYNNTDLNNTDLNNTKEKEIKTNKPTSGLLEKEFEKIWSLYPRKIGKQKSLQAFTKARKIKKIPYETIENGLYRYIDYLQQQETEEQYIMHGSTWFGQQKWQDEYILTGIKQKPKSPEEYLRQKYGQDGVSDFESRRNRKVVNDYEQGVPDVFQGL
jgi:hypothetical protein